MMLLREALTLCQSAPSGQSGTVCLVCSFEPLHLKTYLQAHLLARAGAGAPRIVSFGYDQLEHALQATAGEFAASPAWLCLWWDDLHPWLSWRSRGPFGAIRPEDLVARSQQLQERLSRWMQARHQAETYVTLPPIAALPWHDPQPPAALGPTALAAAAQMWRIAQQLAAMGARILGVAPEALSFRDLLQAGCPLTLEASDALAARIVEAMRPDAARAKLVVVDLDGTLWSGVLAEDGPQGIACGPEGKGAAFFVFQKFLLKLREQGVLLAWCSKNNPEDVLPAFDRLDMPLRLAHFVAWRCNWDPKPQNLQRLATSLNLGWQDFVVIEDNPVEILEIQQALPGLAVWRTPAEGAGWQALLRQLQQRCGAWRVSDEDRLRADTQTRAVLPGGDARPDAPPTDLRELALEVTINRKAFADPRALELINKTNQFNLTGERLSTEQWLQWSQAPGAWCVSAKLRDRFGEFGTIAVATGRAAEDGTLQVRQYVLSCRAFGRDVEHLLMGSLLDAGEWTELRGVFRDTGRNEPARRFLEACGSVIDEESWRLPRQAVERAQRQALERTGAAVRFASSRYEPMPVA